MERSPAASDAELVALRAEVEQLTRALESRNVIGMAQGMRMLRYDIGREEAFQVLVRRSQDGNIKLRDLAPQVIAELRRERPGVAALPARFARG